MGVFKNAYDQVRSGWLILLLAIMIIFFQLLLIIPFMEFGGTSSSPLRSFATGITTEVAIFLGVVFMWLFVQKNPLGEIGLRGNGTGWKDMFWGLGFGAFSMLVIFIILLGTEAIRVGNHWSSPDFSWSNLIYLAIFIAVGFCEEFLFRGYIMKTLEERGNSKWFIYILSSVLFSVAHMGNMEINSIALLNIFLVGLLFAYMFRVTGSLWMPIGFHISWNYTQGIVFGFPVSGNPVDSIYHTQMVVGQEWLSGGGFGPEGGILTTILIGLCMMVTWIYGKKTQPPIVQVKYKNNLADAKQ
jgi:membrane protease YdiL (CAAX protease family)